jgi:hypothetical protein
MNLDEYLTDLPNRVFGETVADNIRHSEARGFFLNLLANHALKQGVFKGWAFAAGVYDIADEFRVSLGVLRSVLSSSPDSEVRLAEAICRQKAAVLEGTLRQHSIPIIVQLSHSYVHKELHLPWDWLVTEMGRAFFAWLKGWIQGQPQTVTFYYMPQEPRAPKVTFNFESGDDETPEAALSRFQQESAQFEREVKAQQKRLKGSMRKDQDVKTYVEWFFRLRVKRETVRRISTHDLNGKRRAWARERKDVNKYALVAERWLGFGFTMENFEKAVRGRLDSQHPPGEVDH